ncbi:DUF421 domain-containing protein, partial [bacterium]|nr:DUF421 domain-containing protein [bacterium]
LSILVEYATFKSKRWEYIVQGRPTLLVHHGKIIRHNLDRERLNVRELKTILRRQGIHDLDDVAEAILESDGYVSVTKKSEAEHANGD